VIPSANLRAKLPELSVVGQFAGPLPFPRSQKSRDLRYPAKADSSPLKQFGMTRSKEFSGIQIRDVQGTLKAHPDTNLREDAGQ
jgi:hypothetical protein